MNEEIKKYTETFHNTYEMLAPQFGYETRKDTKQFDFNSPNGKLMYATIERIMLPILKENKQLKDNWNELKNIIEKGIIDSKAGSSQQYYFNTIYKYMQELEQVKDE